MINLVNNDNNQYYAHEVCDRCHALVSIDKGKYQRIITQDQESEPDNELYTFYLEKVNGYLKTITLCPSCAMDYYLENLENQGNQKETEEL